MCVRRKEKLQEGGSVVLSVALWRGGGGGGGGAVEVLQEEASGMKGKVIFTNLT